MSSYQYRKSHYGDKTILRPSYLHNGISYTDKMTSFVESGPCRRLKSRQFDCLLRLKQLSNYSFMFQVLRSEAGDWGNPQVTEGFPSQRVHYGDVIMGATASQITSLTIVYSTVYSGGDQRKHQSSASLAFVRGINRWPVNSPHKWPVTRKMFPFDDVIMKMRKALPCHHAIIFLLFF